MNFSDQPLNRETENMIPSYPFYGYDNAEELDKDVDYMKSLCSRTLRTIQKEVDEECDKLEYEGSCMFDTFPDQVHLGTIIDTIYDRLKDMDWNPAASDYPMQANQIASSAYYPVQTQQIPGPGFRQPPPCRGANCPPPPQQRPCQGPNCPPPPQQRPCQGPNCPPPPQRPCQGPFCPPPPRPSRPPQPPRPDFRPDGNPDWLRDIISSLLYNEMIHRRRRYRSRQRWNGR